MFGKNYCVDEYGNTKLCSYTFWVRHSCTNHWGDITEEDNGPIEP